jgi:hypothetical protein
MSIHTVERITRPFSSVSSMRIQALTTVAYRKRLRSFRVELKNGDDFPLSSLGRYGCFSGTVITTPGAVVSQTLSFLF